jgi:acetyltransferase
LLVILLPQTPLLNLTRLVAVVADAAQKSPKPLIAVATGGEPTKRFKRYLEERGVPCFDFPSQAVSALNALVGYAKR